MSHEVWQNLNMSRMRPQYNAAVNLPKSPGNKLIIKSLNYYHFSILNINEALPIFPSKQGLSRAAVLC